MKNVLIISIWCLFSLANHVFAQTVSTNSRTIAKLDDGVFVIRHKDAPDGNPQGNTTVIIGSKMIIVVDACYLPSSATEDIEFIKKLSGKPVDYLVNTHWHADHQQGNAEYAKAFPAIKIIAHSQTDQEMRGFENKDIARYLQNLDSLKYQIKTGKDSGGKSLSPKDLAGMVELAAGQDSVKRELMNYVPVFPNLIINDDLELDIGGRTVKILCPGPAHTRGDIMLFLPKEKLLIAGDVVVSPVPYFFGGGYPYSAVKVLEAINRMDVSIIVPGHGQVMNDKVYLKQEIDLLKNVISLVENEVYKQGLLGIKLENVRKAIDLGAYKKLFTKGIKENEDFFDESIGNGLVEGCFNGMAK